MFQFFAQLGESPPIRDLGLIVEHLAGVAQAADMDSCLFEILVTPRQSVRRLRRPAGFMLVALACNSAEQIEHVEFDRGMTQEMGKVPESPRVF